MDVESGLMGSSLGDLALLRTHGGNLIRIKHLKLGLEANRAGQRGSLGETIWTLGALEVEPCVQFCCHCLLVPQVRQSLELLA